MAKTFKSSVFMRRLDKFADAVKDQAFKGAQHPGDHAAIDKAVYDAKLKVVEYVFEHVLNEDTSRKTPLPARRRGDLC